MDIKKGLRLACLYSYGCQQVERMNVRKELLAFFLKKPTIKECKSIIKILEKLQSYRGYCLIKNSLEVQGSCFNPKVVRAYWLGDEGLEGCSLDHNFATLEKFKEINSDEHLPDWIVEDMLDCAISSGKVTKVFSNWVEVLNQRLLYKVGEVIFGEKKRKINNNFGIGLKEGDLVSIHLGSAREKISQERAETLRDITLRALEILKMA